MARRRRTERRLSDAFREAYELAGISQTQIAEATGVDQPRVSKWARGESEPPLEKLPIIDELCGRRRGHVLRLAGYVDDDGADVLAAIERDPALADPIDRDVLREAYRMFSRRPAPVLELPQLSDDDAELAVLPSDEEAGLDEVVREVLDQPESIRPRAWKLKFLRELREMYGAPADQLRSG